MRLLANENVPKAVVVALRAEGHDVAWIREDAPGCTDDSVLARSVAETRLLVTFDKDFGELVFQRGARASAGVVLLRLPATSPEGLAALVASVLQDAHDWLGSFVIVERGRLRIRPLPR